MSPVADFAIHNGSTSRTQMLFIAELANEAGRHDDVLTQLKKIIHQYSASLTLDERNLLAVAYKNKTNVFRNSWRIVDTLEKIQSSRAPHMKRQIRLIQGQREKIEGELADVCKDAVILLDKKLIPGSKPGEARVFYLKMKGDYYRYLAEFVTQKERNEYSEKSLVAYKGAYMHALSVLDASHPTRLGVALNFAVFFHDLQNSPERACHLAKSALDDAVATFKRDATGSPVIESTTKDALTILNLLRDDLLVWSREIETQ